MMGEAAYLKNPVAIVPAFVSLSFPEVRLI
jgi:hypothetical protein